MGEKLSNTIDHISSSWTPKIIAINTIKMLPSKLIFKKKVSE